MRRVLILIALCAFPAMAQSFDPMGGLSTVSCPTPPHYRAFTSGSLSGTAGSITVTDASTIYAAGEPLIITLTGTALDYADDTTDVNRGAAEITSVAGNVISFTNHVTGTVSGAAGFVQPGRMHIETVHTFYGTGLFACTPLNHWIWLEGIAASCAGIGPLGGGNCSFNNVGVTSASQAGGVVTMTQGSTTSVTLGEMIVIAGCADTTYNGTFQVQSVSTPNIFTYNQSTTNSSTTGCKVSASGFRAKYGSDCAAMQAQEARARDLKFNMTFEASDPQFLAGISSCSSPAGGFLPDVPPALIELSQNLYASGNVKGHAPQATMFFTISTSSSSIWGFDRVFNEPLRSNGNDLDWFSPNFSTFFLTHWASVTSLNTALMSPLGFLVMTDDSDHQQLSAASQFFPTFPRGKNSYNPAVLFAITAPYQSYSSGSAQLYASNPQIYSDNVFHSKRLSASPPANCPDYIALTNLSSPPCTLPDFARYLYGTVSAMNTALGTSYTTFGSSETVSTQVTVATGTGGFSSVSISLGANVTLGSVQVYLLPSGGSSIDTGGDCPQIWRGCGGSLGTGALNAAAPCSSTNSVNVQSGYQCLDTNNDVEHIAVGGNTGVTPTWPLSTNCSGTQTTVWGSVTATCEGPGLAGTSTLNYSTGSGTATFTHNVPNNEKIVMSWTNGGWDAGGTGVADEDGSNSWVGTNPVCTLVPAPWQANHTYVPYAIPDSLILDPVTNTWDLVIASTGSTSGSAPSFPTVMGNTVSDGGATWVSYGPGVCGTSGSEDFLFAINATPAYAKFLELWLAQISAQYFKTEYVDAKQLWPDEVSLGSDFSLGSYAGAQDPNTSNAENQYVDGAFTGSVFTTGNTFGSTGNMGFISFYVNAHYFHKPIMEERTWQVGTDTVTAAPSWQNQFGNGGCDGVSQTVQPVCWRATNGGTSALILRTQGHYSQTVQDFTVTNESGQLQHMGEAWWGFLGDFQQAPFACVDNLDNLCDGHENVTGTVPCSGSLSAYNCGGLVASAPWLGIDAIHCTHCLLDANSYWFQTGATTPTQPLNRQPGLSLTKPLLF